ncbi:MAG: hypothetical protein EB096_13215 [Betaproteobacteria bacterium]|nr:hypothetical protein [Betaproteobacteria bacterium]
MTIWLTRVLRPIGRRKKRGHNPLNGLMDAYFPTNLESLPMAIDLLTHMAMNQCHRPGITIISAR